MVEAHVDFGRAMGKPYVENFTHRSVNFRVADDLGNGGNQVPEPPLKLGWACPNRPLESSATQTGC